MRLRTFVIIALTAAIDLAAPKDRPWEDGKLLDNRDNPYFAGKDTLAIDGVKPLTSANEQFEVIQNAGSSTIYEHFVIEGRSAAYLVEFGHLKSYPTAKVTPKKPIKFAVAKSKLWFLDERGEEYETRIIKTVPRPGAAVVTQVQTPASPAAPAIVKPAPQPQVATAVAPGYAQKDAQKDAPKDVPKDRPWQSGQLLSTTSNPFFTNIASTTQTDAGAWTFALGGDGKFTVFIHTVAAPNSSYLYDNYVIESEFCAYLVQRTRLRTVAPSRFPGTKPLKFAIEKSKIWMVDEDGTEYEAKIVKQIQKGSKGESGVRTAAR